MPTDYYSVLVRAISALDVNTDEARRSLYDRARLTVMDAGLAAPETRSVRSALEAAIDRIEGEMRQAEARPGPMRPALPPSGAERARQIMLRLPRSPLHTVALLGAAVVIVVVGYAVWPRTKAPDRSLDGVRISARNAESVPPSSGSAETDRTYILRRQLVYYRTIHPVGTAVGAKSQHYLYLIRPNTAAMRYTIGIGRECANAVGLLRISNMEWPQNRLRQSATAEQRSADPAEKRDAELRFGAPSLELGDTGHRIYGTDPPIKDGDQGCIVLASEDIIDLYGRVQVGTKVVIQ